MVMWGKNLSKEMCLNAKTANHGDFFREMPFLFSF